MMDKARAVYLIQQYRNQNITDAELNELRQWMEGNRDSLLMTDAIEEDILKNAHAEIIGADRLDRMFKNVMSVDMVIAQPPVKRLWIRWVAAASIVLVLGYGLWVMRGGQASKQQDNETVAVHDVPAPSNSRAVITLANGQKVYLDSASNGTIAQESNVSVVKNEKGEIIYSHTSTSLSTGSDAKAQSEIAYNTLSNPRGSKVISLTLSDGTRVWLNSESSLKYPIAFNASTREVEITGEAYFEVKHNAKQPFKVHLPNGSMVEDIGTSFNINAYKDEADIKTTLIEGSVKVVGGDANNKLGAGNGVILRPGEQAVLAHNAQLITRNADIAAVLAWKNGQFNLQSTDLAMLMRQVARWYDVDVEFKGAIPQNKFGGSLNRDLNLSTLLKALQQSGVNAQLEGRKIIIKE